MKKSLIRRFLFTVDSRGADKLSWRVPVGAALLALVAIYIAINSGGPLGQLFTGMPDKRAYDQKTTLVQHKVTDTAFNRGISSDLLNKEAQETKLAADNASTTRPDTNINPEKETERSEAQESNSAADITDRMAAALKHTQQKPEETAAATNAPPTEESNDDDWVPSFMRKDGSKNGGGSSDQNNGVLAMPLPKTDAATAAAEQPPKPKDTSALFDPSEGPQNILPMGTFIACSLDQDVRSDTLSSYVWCTVEIDSTFRRQLQLPRGLARARGKASTNPVGNKVDIAFDVLQFSDGTEVPISGNAYTPFDLRYPDRFKERGIIGELHTPPLYVELEGDLLAGLKGGLGNTGTTSTVNSSFGSFSTTSSKSFLQASGDAVASRLLDNADKMLEMYKPYVTLEKGQPFFIQLDGDIDLNKRSVNGFALATEKSRLGKIGELNALGVPGTQIASLVTGQTPTNPAEAGYVAPVATVQAQTTTQNSTPSNYTPMGSNIQYYPPYPSNTVQTTTTTGGNTTTATPAPVDNGRVVTGTSSTP